MFGSKEKEIDEDPDRMIYPWCSHITVPKWVDKNAYPNCKHCKTLLKTGHKHNCRLCGEMYCSACTGKFHLPSIFELKGKLGASRVCFTCKDSCLEQKRIEKEEEEAKANAGKKPKLKVMKSLNSEDQSSPSSSSSSTSPTSSKPVISEIAPPEWEVDFVDCAKCHKKGGKSHNCRTCGKLFCPKCTSKMQVPSFFEKKGKEGPSRVCDSCRFLIISGAKLVEKITPIEKEVERERGDSQRKRWGSTSQARSCLVSGCPHARVTKKGYCATHANSEDMSDLSSDISLSIRYESETSTICKLAITSSSMTLTDIDRLFKRQQSIAPFSYIYNNEIIPIAFYQVFTAKIFENVLYVRSKPEISEYVAAAVQDLPRPVEDVPAKNNPFKRSDVESAKEESKKKHEEEETKKAPTFKRAEVKKVALPTFSAPVAADLPPPTVSSTSNSSSTTSVPDGADPFKSRAKNVFGAK